MSDIAIAGGQAARRGRLSSAAEGAWQPPDTRRVLQLALAAVWLLDAVLQYQSFMFTKGFGRCCPGPRPVTPR